LDGADEAPEALASIKGRELKAVYPDDGRVRQKGEGVVGEPVYGAPIPYLGVTYLDLNPPS